MKVKVHKGIQVCHEGKVFDDEHTLDVPEATAQFWLRSGWMTEVVKAKGTHR